MFLELVLLDVLAMGSADVHILDLGKRFQMRLIC